MQWRRMARLDIDAVTVLANRVHVTYPEERGVIEARLDLFASGCFVLANGVEPIGGYAISHPWIAGDAPALNVPIRTVPDGAPVFYVHDLALAPELRGSGYASRMAERLIDEARLGGFYTASLVAVSGAHLFWKRQGFEVRDLPALCDPEKGYGPEALYMVRTL
jgi:GNAT superfamily N-acetyltransferase